MPLVAQRADRPPQTLAPVRAEGLPPALIEAKEAIEGGAMDVLELFVCEGSSLTYKVDKGRLAPFLLEAAAAIELGQMDRAMGLLSEDAVRAAVPSTAPEDVLFVIGVLLARTEQWSRAEQAYRRVVQLRPHALAHFELGALCRQTDRVSEAVQHLEKAVALSPESPELRATLADLLIQAGRHRQGLGGLRRLIAGSPDGVSHSKYLWHLHQGPAWDLAGLYEEHRRWGRLHGPSSLARTSHPNDRDPDRRLRVGYVSPDFCGHSVAYFFESLLEGHDPSQVETFGYGHVLSPDQVTRRLQSKFHAYRAICGMDDRSVVRQIEQDRIDILVDLAGHTGHHRLSVFAAKPAPVQVSFLGYPDTTGLEQIDYRFTDRWADLPEAQQFYTERLVPLPSGFVCYRPPGWAPAVGPLPAGDRGFVTFGSFNSNGKIHDRTIRWWSRVLREVPGSQILLKFDSGRDPAVRELYESMFERQGVSRQRVRIMGRLPVLEHLDLYNQVDIALDTFPYHGTTTTCEALWMGVPTVSLIGRHHASRVGLSLLTRVGLEVFAAAGARQYVAKAVAFAGQLDALATIRRSLRNMMLHSPLCDGKAYARDVESAYRTMWRAWCAQGGPHAR